MKRRTLMKDGVWLLLPGEPVPELAPAPVPDPVGAVRFDFLASRNWDREALAFRTSYLQEAARRRRGKR